MFHLLGLDHLVLRVRDMARMERFYTEVLGCEVERRVESLRLVQLRAGHSLIDLIDIASPGGGATLAARDNGAANDDAPDGWRRNLDHFCVRVEPFDQGAIIAHLLKHGVVPGETKRRYGADGYGPSIYISDPEGNAVELKGPPG